MTLMHIRLELARCPEYPNGSPHHGYELLAPLQADGHIDAEQWRDHRKECRVKRFWNGEPDELGHLVRSRRGDWAFHYDIEGDPDDDEVGFRFASHAFRPGEYVSIAEHDGETRTFIVAAVGAMR